MAQNVVRSWGPDVKLLVQRGVIYVCSTLVAAAGKNIRQFDGVVKLLEGPVDAVDAPVTPPPELSACGA